MTTYERPASMIKAVTWRGTNLDQVKSLVEEAWEGSEMIYEPYDDLLGIKRYFKGATLEKLWLRPREFLVMPRIGKLQVMGVKQFNAFIQEYMAIDESSLPSTPIEKEVTHWANMPDEAKES